MYISNICIKRPVLAIVLNLIIIVTGIVSFLKLQVRGTPDIDPPIVSITTMIGGASPEFMESKVTKIIEKSIKNLKNLDHIKSSSYTSFSEVIVTFKISADIEVSLNDIRSKISEILYKLPKNTEHPIISKFDSNQMPSIWLAVTADGYDPLILTDIVEQRIKPNLEQLRSVNNAKIYSNHKYAIQINLDPIKLYEQKLSPIEVATQVASQSQDYPSGILKNSIKEFVLNLSGTLNTPEEFGDVIVKNTNGNLLKIGEIAKVEVKSLEGNSIMRYNGKETVTIGVTKSSKSNVIDLSNEIASELEKIQKSLPDGIKLHLAYDNATPVKESINSVYITAIESIILVLAIIYLFLGSLKIIIIPMLTIPVSLIGAFSFMHLIGFTINIYSLLAMILAIGLVVDDAIIMLENIYRHHQKGMPAIEAAKTGATEIGFAIIVMTLTLSAVFLPIGFIDGFVGKLFIEFAWTLAICVLISGFVALSLSPMLSAYMLNLNFVQEAPQFVQQFNIHFGNLKDIYIERLKWSLNNPRKILSIACLSICLLSSVFYFVKKEFLPLEDESIVIISGTGLDGASTSSTIQSVKEVEKIISPIPEVEGYFFEASKNKLYGFVPLKNRILRKKSQQQIISSLNPILSHIPEMTIFAMNLSNMGNSFEQPITFVLQSYGKFEDLDQLSLKFLEEIQKNKIFKNADRDLRTSIPSLKIDVERDIAAKSGVLLDQIGTTLQYLIGLNNVSQFSVGNEKYDVMLGFGPENRRDISDLSKIFIKSQKGEMIHLSDLANITETISVESYNHYNSTKAVQISSALIDNASISDAKNEIESIAARLLDKSTISLEFLGEIKRMAETNSNMLFTFGISILFIYLMLSAQFESFSDPLIILIAVPFSITGGVLALFLFGSSINLYSNIGIVTLIGLITKNSIMIVEFANQLLEKGNNKLDSIIASCSIRFRPILMTTLATMLGSVPLVLANGASSAARNSIGLVIIGGMLIGTLFTLFIIPAIYFRFKR